MRWAQKVQEETTCGNKPSGGGSREEWGILGGAESGDGWLDDLMMDFVGPERVLA